MQLYYGSEKEKRKLSNEEEVKEVLKLMKGKKFEVAQCCEKRKKT